MNNYSEEILKELKRRGKITFAEFMNLALYLPKYGYYMREEEKIGVRGDFYTAPTVSNYFGYAIAEQLKEIWSLLGEPKAWQVVEWGAGKGKLAFDVLTHLKKEYPRVYEALDYYLLEISSSMQKQQKKILEDFNNDKKVFWINHLKEANQKGVVGCVFSNELVDAFPFHRLQMKDGRWQEIYISYENDTFVESLDELSAKELLIYLKKVRLEVEEGQIIEVSLAFSDFMYEISLALKQGVVLTIDYGGKALDIFSPARYNGSLRCYHKHQLIENPFEYLGQCDITSHVDFDALIFWGDRAGLNLLGYKNQARFLMNLGILELLKNEPKEKQLKETLAIKKLIMPEGMGSIFKVLGQYKGIESKPQLKGLI